MPRAPKVTLLPPSPRSGHALPAVQPSTWVAGQSGNPHGNSRRSFAISTELRRLGEYPQANLDLVLSRDDTPVNTLIAARLLRFGCEDNAAVALKAIPEIFDRTEGKAVQANVVLGAPLNEASARELTELARELLG